MEKITEKKINYTLFEDLKERLLRLQSAIKDYRTTIWDKAGQDTTAAAKINSVLSKRIAQFTDFMTSINEDIAKTEDELNAARNLVALIKNEHLLSMFDNYQVHSVSSPF